MPETEKDDTTEKTELENPEPSSTAPSGTAQALCAKCGLRPRQRGRTSCSKCRERTKYKLVRVPFGIEPVGNTGKDLDGEQIFPLASRSARASTFVNSVDDVKDEYITSITTAGQKRSLSTLFVGEHMTCGVETLEGNCEIPDHSHDYSEEMINIISGNGMLCINGQKDGVLVQAGSMLFIPPKLVHKIRNMSDSVPLVFNYVLSPPVKIERMIAGREKPPRATPKRKQTTLPEHSKKKQKKESTKKKETPSNETEPENPPEDSMTDL